MLLRPGKSCDEAIKLLTEITEGELNDTRNAIPRTGGPGYAQLMQSAVIKYEKAINLAIRKLQKVFVESELVLRLRGEKYWLIVASDVESSRTASMMHTELSDLASEFQYAANELYELKARFVNYSGRCLVLDTNDLLHYQRFDKIPWSKIYRKGAWVVLPHVVLDEIDRKSYEEGQKIRTRARGVYKVLESILDQIESTGSALLDDGSPCVIFTDEPGHNRRTNNDDEIVFRASYLQQALAPGQVTLVTRDIGMRARALAQNLKAESLPEKYLIPEDGFKNNEMEDNLRSITQAR
jgi:hypothetical protein